MTAHSQATTTVNVRFFAGVAAAAGTDEHIVHRADAVTVADLVAALAAQFPAARAAIGASSLLLDGVSVDDPATHPINDARTLDVLPPFAGG